MIDSNNEVSKDLEKALQALEQAKQRVANEKKNRMRRNGKPRNYYHPIHYPQCR